MKNLKIFSILFTLSCISLPCLAANENTPNNLHIIPEAQGMSGDRIKEGADKVNYVGDSKKWWSVNDRYNEKAEEINGQWDLWMAFQTWIMSWDTILLYVVYFMRFLNQIWLLIWSIMILFAWYLYASSVFKPWNTSKGKTAIETAIKWILVIVFSYAIWKGLEAMFL